MYWHTNLYFVKYWIMTVCFTLLCCDGNFCWFCYACSLFLESYHLWFSHNWIFYTSSLVHNASSCSIYYTLCSPATSWVVTKQISFLFIIDITNDLCLRGHLFLHVMFYGNLCVCTSNIMFFAHFFVQPELMS